MPSAVPATIPTDHGPLAIRFATEADVVALVTLVTSAYRGDASRAGWTTEADLLDGQRTDPEGVRELVVDPTGAIMPHRYRKNRFASTPRFRMTATDRSGSDRPAAAI